MTIRELLSSIHDLHNEVGDSILNAEVKTSGDEEIEFTLDLSYSTNPDIVYINTVVDTGEDEE